MTWNDLSEEVKQAWCARAELVNQLPVLGQFAEIPSLDILQKDTILHSINLEFDNVVKFFQNDIKTRRHAK